MPIPGLPHQRFAGSGLAIGFTVDAADVDLHALLGSPTGATNIFVTVDAGVTLYSTVQLQPALDFRGFALGSTAVLINNGLIAGVGGNGGVSFAIEAGTQEGAGGGGGGGAGYIPGTGSEGRGVGPDASVGADGTNTVGGAGGALYFGNGVARDTQPDIGTPNFFDGNAGGDAVDAGDTQLVIRNALGVIQGGGGGGGGGGSTLLVGRSYYAGAGGSAPGVAGLTADPLVGSGFENPPGGAGGAAGFAVRRTASGSILFLDGGSPPNVIGPVGV